MLAKMPQKTVKSPFRNKLTILSLVLLMGLGLSAAYFTVPFLEVPVPTPDNLIGNTTNNTVSAPVTHTGSSAIKIQTPSNNTTTNTTSTNVNNQSTTGKQNTNTSKTSSSSKTTTTTKSNTNSKTTPSSTNTKKTTNSTG